LWSFADGVLIETEDDKADFDILSVELAVGMPDSESWYFINVEELPCSDTVGALSEIVDKTGSAAVVVAADGRALPSSCPKDSSSLSTGHAVGG
jgi:hypothetical protein